MKYLGKLFSKILYVKHSHPQLMRLHQNQRICSISCLSCGHSATHLGYFNKVLEKKLFFGSFSYKNIYLFCQNYSIPSQNNIDESFLLCNLYPDIAKLVRSDPALKEKVDVILEEYNYYMKEGKGVPTNFTSEHIMIMLELDTRSRRYKFLRFLRKKENLKLSKKAKQERKLAERNMHKKEAAVTDEADCHMKYGLGENSLFISVREKLMRKFYCKRLANAALFGEKIIIDLEYDEHMWRKERRHCAAQLSALYGVNRIDRNPFDLFFCNAKPSYETVKFIKEILPNSFNADSLVTVTENSYLDLFPKDKLVYLSPHAKDTLKQFNHGDIYIIGGFVDTVKRDHLSIAKAEKEGIRSYSLPIDEYVWWGYGSRSLSINHVFEIMLKLKNSGDWRQAFEVIPKRKIRKVDQCELDNNELLPNKMYVVNTS